MALKEETIQAIRQRALRLHRESQGKIEVFAKVPLRNTDDLALAYTPGVAEACLEIHRDPDLAYEYTAKANLVAIVTDGTAVLGLGDIGPAAGMPVMEGKALLFKAFAGIDAFPLCVAEKDPDGIVRLVKALEPTFGGVNLEDIAAPRCFEIENRLKKETGIPIFHDDQHGTAIVTAAALLNALQLVGKRMADVRVVFNGAGASGIATTKLLLDMGVQDVILCDTRGPIYEGRREGMNPFKEEIAARTNRQRIRGTLADALRGADVFIGLSAGGAVSMDMVRSMANDAIIMAMANPVPEIYPDDAIAAGAKVVATGRSDFPNQINNVLAFPGVLRGALDVRATDINEPMKQAAARAIAALVSARDLTPDYIIPNSFDRRVAPAVAAAVAEAAVATGVARIRMAPEAVADKCRRLVERVAARENLTL